jgi:hypothetical protein
MSEPITSTKTKTPGRRRRGRIVLWSLLVLLLVGITWAAISGSPFAGGLRELAGWKPDKPILQATFSIGPHGFRYYKVDLPQDSTNVAAVGQFNSSNDARTVAQQSDDAGGNIEFYILSELAFAAWQSGSAGSSVYESGRVSQGTVNVELPEGAGIYYLVFSNKFSSGTKSVRAALLLRYKGNRLFHSGR